MGVVEDLQNLAESTIGWDTDSASELCLDAIEEIRALRATVRVLTTDLTDCRRKQEFRKPCGPLGKVELRKAMQELFGRLYECESELDVNWLEVEYGVVLNQCAVDLPEWMEGLNGQTELGWHGRKEQVLELCKQVK